MRLNETIANHFSAGALAALAEELGQRPAAASAASAATPASPADVAAALLANAVANGRVAALLEALAGRAPTVDWVALAWPPAALAALHDALDRRLSREDLRDLCLRLGVDYDDLPGEGKRARVRELVLRMARAGRLVELEEEVNAKEVNARSPRSKDAKKKQGVTARQGRRAGPATGKVALRWAVAGLLVLCLVAVALVWRAGRGWTAGPALPEGVVGVAVAEFAETVDCRRGARGREASALVYETLGRELAAAGLARRVGLTRVGRVCDAAAAVAAGQAVGAEVVVWGWRPAAAEGLVATFTPSGSTPAASADLARAFEALFSGPDEASSLRLSGRALALTRFLLGLVRAGQGEPAQAEALYDAAIAAVEAELAAAGPGEGAELRRTLAVLLTERGKARATLGRPADARADYDRAEALNPDYLRLLIARAAEAYNRRDWAAAESYLDRAALQDEPLPTIAYGYGLLDYYRGRYATAIAAFGRAIALSAADGSDAAVYHLARGYGYAELGDCAAAVADFRAAGSDAAAPAAVRGAAASAGCGTAVASVAAGGTGGRPPSATAGETSTPPVAGTSVPATRETSPRLSPLEMAAAAPTRAAPTRAAPTPATTPASATATPTPGPLLVEVGPRGANVRRGPGAEYPVMATRRAGETLEVLAANPSGEWLQVRVPGQGRGWVSAAYAVARGDLGALAIGSYQPGLIIAGASAATPSAAATATPAWPRPATATPAYPPRGATPPGATPTPPPPPNGPPPTQTPPAVWWPTPTATLLPAPTARR